VRDWDANNGICLLYDHETDLCDRIAAALTAQYQRGVDAGREEAARIADVVHSTLCHGVDYGDESVAQEIAAEIRSRIGKGVEDGE
jgi:hypothetical protein